MSQLPDSSTDFATAVGKGTKTITTYNKKKAQTLWNQGLKELGIKNVNVKLLGDDVDAVEATQEYLQGTLQENLPGLKISIASVPAKNRQQRASTRDFDMVLSTGAQITLIRIRIWICSPAPVSTTTVNGKIAITTSSWPRPMVLMPTIQRRGLKT